MKHTLKTRLIITLGVIVSVFAANFLPAQPAHALTCSILPTDICKSAETKTSEPKDTGIFKLLVWVLRILTAGVGIAAVGAVIYAGILYASAGSGPEQVKQSKKIITDVAIGIIVYALMFLVINWLVPGGVIG